MKCKDATVLVEQGLERLSFPRRVRVRLHIFFCHACTTYRRFSLFVAESLRAQSEAQVNVDVLNQRLLESFKSKS